MRILILGDVIGRPGRRAIRELVPPFVKSEGIELVIANAENSAGGIGVDIKSAEELFFRRRRCSHLRKSCLEEERDLFLPGRTA